jgi:deoxycytidylate deaminase
MVQFLPRIKSPELFIGFVAPIGADLAKPIAAFKAYFDTLEYRVIPIKVTDVFRVLTNYVPPDEPLTHKPRSHERLSSHIKYGDQLRAKFDEDAILAATTVQRLIKERTRLKVETADRFSGNVFLLHQFKRKEEIDFLRAIYGRLFFQVSVYSRRGARVDSLAHAFSSAHHSAHSDSFRARAEEIVQTDRDEAEVSHGQRVASIFHDADFIINLDVEDPAVESQVDRFCDLLFSSNSISPTRMEYGMYAAKAAALRTLDLSRQVGAAIFSKSGQIISLGSNEVPKAGGGTYWAGEPNDDRDYVRSRDSNDVRKRELLEELVEMLGIATPLEEVLSTTSIRESQLMDALEYGRIVHAEMSAIGDAACSGQAIKDGILYCTTFPCHMCAKHIVASGLDRVVFLEPYPKSLAARLHSDSIEVEKGDRGKYAGRPAVVFEHFFGITPRRYRELFERGKRKDSLGNFVEYDNGERLFYLDIKLPLYARLEELVLKRMEGIFAEYVRKGMEL